MLPSRRTSNGHQGSEISTRQREHQHRNQRIRFHPQRAWVLALNSGAQLFQTSQTAGVIIIAAITRQTDPAWLST